MTTAKDLWTINKLHFLAKENGFDVRGTEDSIGLYGDLPISPLWFTSAEEVIGYIKGYKEGLTTAQIIIKRNKMRESEKNGNSSKRKRN